MGLTEEGDELEERDELEAPFVEKLEDKVPVSTELLAAVKSSYSKYKAEKDLEQEAKRKAEDIFSSFSSLTFLASASPLAFSSAFLFVSSSRSLSAFKAFVLRMRGLHSGQDFRRHRHLVRPPADGGGAPRY